MQDNIVYKIELTAEEYEYVESLKKEYYENLRQMTKKVKIVNNNKSNNTCYNSMQKFSI